MDVLIHTWDLARAASQDEKDPDLVDACTAMFLPEMPERGQRRHRRARRRSRRGRLGAGSTVGGDGAPSMTDPALEDAIRALAHPGRAMLRLVWDKERPATELAEAAGLSPSAASQHLKQLRDTGLITVRVESTRRLYRADLTRVAEVASFLDDFWAAPLDRLRASAEKQPRRRPSCGSSRCSGW